MATVEVQGGSGMRLDKVQSPECRKCGCNATHLVRVGQRFGDPWARFQCDHCGHEFTIGREPDGEVAGVPYNTVHCRCPVCNAVNPTVTSSPRPIRRHACQNCGATFKSFEIPS